ncbi:MAG: NAD-dependent epimerase/dehydratase family protein, partial [Synergistaceae bacterium]|nr:NAD-dependent epimerase/dehydratase family protein [Synergistaceae bacterium]
MKKVLITGANSYIGTSFANWAALYHGNNITTETIDMKQASWREKNFSEFDAVFHVAGIAHADTGRETDEEKARYFAVNRDLAVETAAKAKQDGVGLFVMMSSMLVYGNVAYAGRVNENTTPTPTTCYALSKWQADEQIRALADEK